MRIRVQPWLGIVPAVQPLAKIPAPALESCKSFIQSEVLCEREDSIVQLFEMRFPSRLLVFICAYSWQLHGEAASSEPFAGDSDITFIMTDSDNLPVAAQPLGVIPIVVPVSKQAKHLANITAAGGLLVHTR